MKRIVCIILAVMVLTTGCSFIGQKDNSDSEPIIPTLAQSGQEENTVANASVNLAENGNSSIAGTTNSSTNEAANSTPAVSEISSNLPADGIIIDNGMGKGVSADSSNKSNVLITLYYCDKYGLLVPVTRSVPKQEGLAKAAINGLIDEAVTREQLDYYGLYPVLPKGTKIKGMNIKNGDAVIDLSKEFTNLETAKDERRAVASVVYTLTGFQTISNVSIRIDGRDIQKLNNGTDLSGMMNRSNTFINSEETSLKDGYTKCDLYYMASGNGDFNYMIPISTQVQNNGDSLPISLFDELSKKPADSSYFTSLPDNTKLLSCDIQNNTAVLDFSSEISNYGGTEKENSLLNQIYYTISQLKGIQRVKILINGKETTLPEGTEVALAKILPTTFNKVIDK